MEKRLINIDECASYLSLTKKAIYNMINRKKIPFVKIGTSVRFDLRSLEMFIQENSVDSEKKLTK